MSHFVDSDDGNIDDYPNVISWLSVLRSALRIAGVYKSSHVVVIKNISDVKIRLNTNYILELVENNSRINLKSIDICGKDKIKIYMNKDDKIVKILFL